MGSEIFLNIRTKRTLMPRSAHTIQNAKKYYYPLRLYEMCRSRSPTDLSSRGVADEGREDFPLSLSLQI